MSAQILCLRIADDAPFDPLFCGPHAPGSRRWISLRRARFAGRRGAWTGKAICIACARWVAPSYASYAFAAPGLSTGLR